MISAAHDDSRPTATVTPPTGIPTARVAHDDVVHVVPLPVPATPAPTVTPAPPAGEGRDQHVERMLAELEADATAASWALRLALLGVVGLVVVLMMVL